MQCIVLTKEVCCILAFQVTSEALSSIAYLLKLEVLTMAGCPLVDDVGLRFLEKGCPSLKVKE